MVTRRWTGRPRRLLVAGGLCVALLGACSSGDDSKSPTVPLPTLAPSTAASTPSPTSVSRTSTTETTQPTTTVLNPPPTITNPTTSPTTSVSLPPVTTLVPEVPTDLLNPEQLDPASPNNSRPILPEHLPVLEAYLSGTQATTKISSTWPIDPDSPLLVGAPLTPEVVLAFQEASRGRLERGEVLNVSQGSTSRPYVVGPVTDKATVLDCELAGEYWVKAASGELIAPNEIWPAGPGRIVELGISSTLVFRDGRWLLAASRITPDACG